MPKATIGTRLEVQDAKTGVWSEIDDIQSIPALGGTPQEIDVTNLTDTETSSIPGVKQQSSIAIVLYMNNTKPTDNYRKCRNIELSGEVHQFRISFPDGTRVIFRAILTTSINEVAVNAAQMFTATLFKRGDFNIQNPDGSYVILDPIDDMQLFVGDFDSIDIHTTPVDGVILSATSATPDTVIASVNARQLTVTGLKVGSSEITVTAKLGENTTSSTKFTVTVKAVGTTTQANTTK